MHDDEPSTWPFWLSLGGTTLDGCVGNSWLKWILILECLGVLVSYLIIARNWHHLEKLATSNDGKRALRSLRNIFVLCGICGYATPIVRTFVPAWSPTLFFYLLLNLESWRYVRSLRGLEAIHKDAATLDKLRQHTFANETPIETLSRVKSLLDANLESLNADRRN